VTQFGFKNCSPEIKKQITDLTDGLKDTLNDRLVGIYLHGSLAMNCFNPLRSDIDLLVVTNATLASSTKTLLTLFLLKISRKPAPIEAYFIRRDVLDPWKFPTPFEYYFAEDWRQAFGQAIINGETLWAREDQADSDLAEHIGVLRRRGVSLLGPNPNELFPIVPEEDYLDAIFQDLLGERHGLNTASTKPVSVLLNACRAYAYLHNEQILSKEEAGEWAARVFPPRYRPVIQEALMAYRQDRDDSNFSGAGLKEFIEFVRADFERFAAASGGLYSSGR
jgi:streptomycin 3"-adenylyltransferase